MRRQHYILRLNRRQFRHLFQLVFRQKDASDPHQQLCDMILDANMTGDSGLGTCSCDDAAPREQCSRSAPQPPQQLGAPEESEGDHGGRTPEGSDQS